MDELPSRAPSIHMLPFHSYAGLALADQGHAGIESAMKAKKQLPT
jgi:hypothetical protein